MIQATSLKAIECQGSEYMKPKRISIHFKDYVINITRHAIYVELAKQLSLATSLMGAKWLICCSLAMLVSQSTLLT